MFDSLLQPSTQPNSPTPPPPGRPGSGQSQNSPIPHSPMQNLSLSMAGFEFLTIILKDSKNDKIIKLTGSSILKLLLKFLSNHGEVVGADMNTSKGRQVSPRSPNHPDNPDNPNSPSRR